MDRIPPVLKLSLDVALDFFTTSANTKRYAPLSKDGDFLYVQDTADGKPAPLVFTSWTEAVAASEQHGVPYIAVAGNGRVVERIQTAYGGNDYGRVVPVPPPEYAEYAGQAMDTRKPAASDEEGKKRARAAAAKRKSRSSKRHPNTEIEVPA